MADGQVVWSDVLDGQYVCAVRRTSSHEGELTVSLNDEVIHKEEVWLSFGAEFGPDGNDVGSWQIRCEQVVDKEETTDG